MTKKIYLLALLTLSLSFANAQQNALSVSIDSLYFSGPNAASVDDFSDLYEQFTLRNDNAASDSFVWIRTMNVLPTPEWSSAVCDINLCHGANVDSAYFEMNVGDSGIFYTHFYPGIGHGLAMMRVEIMNRQDRTQKISVVAYVNAWNAFASQNNINLNEVLSYPNPLISDILTVENFTGNLIIKDMHGRTVKTTTIATYNEKIDLSSLSKGNYTLLFQSENTLTIRKLIIN
jgi:hypothetical protein